MRRNLRTFGGMALIAAIVVSMAACEDAGDSDGGKAAGKCGGKIATFGAFTGANAGLVIPSLNGMKLAVKQHNAANADCKVEMVEFDTQGSADQATPIANRIVGDQSFLGVIGGAFSGESKATMPIYEAAGVVMVSQSATAVELTAAGNKSFHRIVGHDGTQGQAAAKYLKDLVKAQKVFVVDDGTTYGAGIAAETSKNLGSLVVGNDKVQEKQTNFDATISKINSAKPDYVAYAGYTNEAAPLLKQMRAAGITAKFIGFDGLYDPGFPAGAGAAAEGAIITCPCAPTEKAAGTFAADFQKEFGQAGGAYAAEGFDAAQILIDGLKAGKTTRADLLAFVNSYDKAGASKSIKFDQNGDIDKSKVSVWAYEVKGGAITPQQEVKLS